VAATARYSMGSLDTVMKTMKSTVMRTTKMMMTIMMMKTAGTMMMKMATMVPKIIMLNI